MKAFNNLIPFSFKTLYIKQLAHSDATSVTLRGVTRDLTGQFQCEVSEDAPLFHTDIRTAVMQVIELPNDEPRMIVEKKTLYANDNLKASCTVGTSFPSANISWYINNKKVSYLFIFKFYRKFITDFFYLKNRSINFHFNVLVIEHLKEHQHTLH